MGYTEAIINSLIKEYYAKIILVHWDLKKVSAHHLSLQCEEIIPRSKVNRQGLFKIVDQFKPDLLYVSGWMDKLYLSVARYARRQGIPVVSGMDTPWNGGFRQILSTTLLKGFWQKNFDYIWVPGKRQVEYANRLGFKNKSIPDLYSADVQLFRKAWSALKRKSYPHRLFFAGRLTNVKGIKDLLKAFLNTNLSIKHDWKLIIAGNGALESLIPSDPSIEFIGFQKPESLMKHMSTSGAFCLPSHYEPWGVVIHEAVSAGLPLILSEACGAREVFLQEGKNGFTFHTGNIEDLTSKLIKLFNLPDETLSKMGEKSIDLSETITPSKSAGSLIQILNNE